MVNQEAIFIPFLGMMLLTLLVWIYMYIRRLGFLFANRTDAQSVSTPEQLARAIPDEVNYPAHNLKNLFELPVLFYAVCLYLFITAQVDSLYLACAWVFLGFRAIHSIIQCTVNIVILRFIAYLVASLSLWFMITRSLWQLL